MSVDGKGAWLQDLGYRFGFRRNTWVECLVTGRGEGWCGAGWTEAEALDDAIEKMFPSYASRTLLQARFGIGQSIEVLEGTPESEVAIDVAVELAADSPSTCEESGASAEESSGSGEIEDTEGVLEAVPVSVPPPRHPAALTRRVLPNEALEELADLERTILTTKNELVFATAERQRLVMLSWIAQARSLGEALPSIDKVGRIVGRIATTLGGYCKSWWPGSVRALQQAATPSDAAAEFEWERPHEFLSWAEVAERADRILNERIEEDEERGYDEYGWADEKASYPPPPDVVSLQTEVRHQLEAHAGPVGEPPSLDRAADRMISAYRSSGILALARKTRWLRRWTTEPMEWGALIGRLRWLSYQGDHRLRALGSVLSPERRGLPWAYVLGVDPNKREKQRARRKLLETLSVGDPGKDPGWPAWLVSAFDHFETRRMARLLGRRAEEIRSIEEDALLGVVDPDQRRRTRSRLKKLKEALADLPLDEESASFELEAELSKVQDITQDEEPTTDPHEALRAKVLSHTKGRRALFVSNRNDPDLKSRLVGELEFEELEWSDGSVRRSEALAEAIRKKRFDLVLLATGFQSHKLDNLLSRACRSSDIPFLRVNRGRPLAVYQAIERSLPSADRCE